MDKTYLPIGKHVIFDLKGIPYDILNDEEILKEIYEDAIELSGATIRKYQSEIFDPDGLTFTFILAESHASAHTYPPNGVLMGCIHTCGEHVDPNRAVDHIIASLAPEKITRKEIERGVFD